MPYAAAYENTAAAPRLWHPGDQDPDVAGAMSLRRGQGHRPAAARGDQDARHHGEGRAGLGVGQPSGQVHEQFEKMRARLEEKRDDFDAKAAERRAERAEANDVVRNRHFGHAPAGPSSSTDRLNSMDIPVKIVVRYCAPARNAADAVDFARYALDEAEAAALEAADARKIADALRPGAPSSAGEN